MAEPAQFQEKKCVRCQAAFPCGASATEEHCWCVALPHVSPTEDATDCLCPACLEREIESRATVLDI